MAALRSQRTTVTLYKFTSIRAKVNGARVTRFLTIIMTSIKVGVIGGSGLDDPNILKSRSEKVLNTPFGTPSDVLIEGTVEGVDCVLLARHGRGHTIMPSNINYRANIWALKEIGCTHLIVSTACGSLREEIKPGDIVFPNQFIDRTTKRANTFYDGAHDSPKGVCHIPMHTPFCPHTNEVLIKTAIELGIPHHISGTVITIEGPRFSTKAESKMFQLWGADIINMTTVPEVVLAKEAGLSYAAIAMATDYDCWRDCGEAVSAHAVLETFKQNVQKVLNLIKASIPRLAKEDWNSVIKQNKCVAEDSVMSK